MRHRSKQKKKSGGGSKGGIWGLRTKFGTRPTRIHLARPEKQYTDPETGEKEDFLLVTEHFVRHANGGKGAGLRCGETCVVCAYTSPQEFDLDVEVDEKLSKCYPRDQFVVSGWLEEPHHIVEEEGKNDPTKKFKVRKRCHGQKCKHCRAGVETVFGNRFYFGFSGKAWTASLAAAHIGASQVCHCGGICYAVEYKCSNPKCGVVLYDALAECNACSSKNVGVVIEKNQDDEEAVYGVCEDCNKQWPLSLLENEGLAEDVMEDVHCPECNEVGVMTPVMECTEEGCEGEPHDIFDCQLKIRKESDQQTAPLVIDSWRIREPDERLFDPAHQGGEEEAATMKELIDLTEVYKPQTTNEQAQLLKVRDPFAPSKGSGVRQYQDTEEDD